MTDYVFNNYINALTQYWNWLNNNKYNDITYYKNRHVRDEYNELRKNYERAKIRLELELENLEERINLIYKPLKPFPTPLTTDKPIRLSPFTSLKYGNTRN